MDSNDNWLGGRQAVDWELPALERAREHERDQAMRLLAGVLTDGPVERYEGRTISDLLVEMG